MSLNKIVFIPLIIIEFAIACFGSALVVDDFELRNNINLIGGLSSVWEKDLLEESEYCVSEFLQDNISGSNRPTIVLKLNYKVTESAYNGYYSKLNGINIRAYTLLEFFIKCGTVLPSVFKIELKNYLGESGSYAVTGINQNWRKISIPLNKFRGITDFSKMTELVFVFEGERLGNSSGEIFLDDIVFDNNHGEYEYESRNVVIQEQIEQKKREFEKISRLPKDELLELISKKTFNYFWNESNYATGFVKDRSRLDSPSSIAATGFGLTAICIGDSRKWITHQQAYDRVKKTLEAIKTKLAGEHGFFYHFVNMHIGSRVWNSEISSVDTALLLAGVITAKEYFLEQDIKLLCDEIYSGVEWTWIMDDKSKTLYMGWTPEDKFKKFILWDMFGEEMLIYVLGLGSPTYPLPEDSWDSFRRPVKSYKNQSYIYCESESLFTYQYSHGFIDFRNKYDKYANYWNNSLTATKSSIEFCKEHKDKYKTYMDGFWGLSASDGPYGYKNYGATIFTNDGTIAPYAICASMPFVPQLAISTLRKLLFEHGYRVWDDRYGFVSAFNIDANWFSTEHIGIDLGITLVMIENYRSDFVWKYFMKNPYIQKGLERAYFKSGGKKIDVTHLKSKFGEEKSEFMPNVYTARAVKSINELKDADFIDFSQSENIEFGSIKTPTDLSAKFAFLYNDEYLYFIVDVTDNKIIASEKKDGIYRSDCVELYLSPNSDTLIWGDKRNFQIGFAPNSIEKKPIAYAFFQNVDPEGNVDISVRQTADGYKINSKIKWSFLGMKPENNAFLGMSVAAHDIDKDGSEEKKINWSFKNTPAGIKLGKLKIK
ncbi:MAG: glucoamylase family protein [Elusimicrobiota bacterium]